MDKLKGVIFDLDGVLVETQLDFRRISTEIFGAEKFPLLEHIFQIEDPLCKKRALIILDKHESRAAVTCKLKEGIPELFELLNERGIKKGVVTRNSKKSVDIVIQKFGLTFDVIVTRENAPPKPAKDPVILAYKKMHLSCGEVLFLGDYEFDMMAGKRAGVLTVLLKNHSQHHSDYADVTVQSIPDFTHYVEKLASPPSPLT